MAKKNEEPRNDNNFEFLGQEQTKQENNARPDKKPICTNCETNLAKQEEYKNLLQLSVADFDNYRKRSLKMMQEAKLDGELNVIMRFLPALDSFAKAKKMITDENILKGVEMIEKEVRESLKQIGVKEMTPLGEKFDPMDHNAISVSHNPDIEDDIITDVYQNGYIYNGKVIRYAQVIINKKGELK